MTEIYLDAAATSLWRPMAVAEAAARSILTHAGYGRDQSAAAEAAAEEVYACREAAARLFGLSDPARAVFCASATHALNTAIFGLCVPGKACVASCFEHNAAARPLYELARRGVSEVFTARAPLFDADGLAAAFERLIEEKAPGLVVCTMVGNVFGNRLPVERIGACARAHGAAFVCDASQAAGTLDVDVRALGADAVCVPGHKGLLGPTGTGLLLAGGRTPRPLLFGGTGVDSELPGQPETLPERLESGTLNVCGICGLRAGLEYVAAHRERLHRRKSALCAAAAARLAEAGFSVFDPGDGFDAGVFSFDPGFDSERAAGILAENGIAVRGGLHCAPAAHRAAGTLARGTVRISPGPDLRRRAVDRAGRRCAELLARYAG